jgi:hypothetical protein
MFHLQCIILSETCWSKNAETAEIGHIYQPVNVLNWVPELRVQRTKPLPIKAEVCCMRVCNGNILACIVLASNCKIFSTSKAFLHFVL